MLGLDVMANDLGSYVDQNSEHGFVSQQDEEEKQPETSPASNIIMSGQTDRVRRDRSQQSRAFRAKHGNLLEKINNAPGYTSHHGNKR